MAMLKARFKAGRMDVGTFRNELKKMRYPPEEIGWIIQDTQAEMGPERELTKAEVLRAYREKFKTESWAKERLSRIYADSEDVELLLAMNRPKED